MTSFRKGIFTIESMNGRLKDSRLFATVDDIESFVKQWPPGKYHVSSYLSGSNPPGTESEPWATAIHHADGHVTFVDPVPVEAVNRDVRRWIDNRAWQSARIQLLVVLYEGHG